MGRIIRMTESQVNAIIRHLSEGTADVIIDGTSNAANKNSIEQGVRDTITNATQNGLPADKVKVVIDGDRAKQIQEKFLTKRQINEKRLKYLRENSVRYTKKQIERK